MFAEKSKKNKQLLAEKLWLIYFNDVLYQDGIITQSDYHKIIHKINSRAKDLDKQNDFFARKNKQ